MVEMKRVKQKVLQTLASFLGSALPLFFSSLVACFGVDFAVAVAVLPPAQTNNDAVALGSDYCNRTA